MHIVLRSMGPAVLWFVLSGCSVGDTPSAPSAPDAISYQLVRVAADGSELQPVNVPMGATLDHALKVRVVDAVGNAAPGAPVRFVHAQIDTVVTADLHGVAALAGWTMPTADTLMVSTVASASLVGASLMAASHAGTPAMSMRFVAHAWRDLTHFGGTDPARFDRLPVERSALEAIQPLGTFVDDEGLPSSAARLRLRSGETASVRAISAGLIIAVDRGRGAVTMRVRDSVRVEIAGIALRSDLHVGQVLQAGEALGTTHATSPDGSTTGVPGIELRVLDATATRSGWARPERYGARTSAVFFGRYLVDSLRAHTYALVRRAAPDLDGRIDYDREGRLVGTWFDPAVNERVPAAPDRLPALPASTVLRDERDPSPDITPFALTFAYDAEQPGQVRIAGGAILGARLGMRGVLAVAWEDVDPASVGVETGLVRYRLYATTDSARVETAHRLLLVQVLDADHLRAEVVSADGDGRFSPRATILVR